MKHCGIYGIVNKLDGKIYIGSSANICLRWTRHKYEASARRHRNPHFQHAWNLCGKDVFGLVILEEVDRESLDAREAYWIARYDSTNRDHGYNVEGGGNRNKSVSEETRERLRLANLGRRHSPETIRKITEGNRGKKCSEESKRRMSEAQKKKFSNPEERRKVSEGLKGNKNCLGRKLSERHRNILVKCRTGFRFSEESRRKMSESHKGQVPWHKGRSGVYRHSNETRRKMSESHKGKRYGRRTTDD